MALMTKSNQAIAIIISSHIDPVMSATSPIKTLLISFQDFTVSHCLCTAKLQPTPCKMHGQKEKEREKRKIIYFLCV